MAIASFEAKSDLKARGRNGQQLQRTLQEVRAIVGSDKRVPEELWPSERKVEDDEQ